MKLSKIYIITIPHQCTPKVWSFEDKKELIDVAIIKGLLKDIHTFKEAVEALTHDLSRHLLLRDWDELLEAQNYGGHQDMHVIPLVDKIKKEELSLIL